jgi:hypothetical protein
VAMLALFWLISGLVGFLHFDAAVHVLTDRGVGQALAAGAVSVGSLIDIGLGVAVAIRRWHVPALAGMLATALFYLVAGTWFSPDLWGDPLGPFVKVLPAMALCLVALAIAGDR